MGNDAREEAGGDARDDGNDDARDARDGPVGRTHPAGRHRRAGGSHRRREAVARLLALAAVALCAGTLGGPAQAQAWPSKPLRFVVGFPPGSTTDAVARLLAEQVRAKLGQPVIVENRPGANGMLGAAEVARAPADGYTVLVTNSSSITVNPQIYRKITYLPERDFAPLVMATSAGFVLTVNPANERTAPIATVADMVARAKAMPGRLTYGSGGLGNLAHLGFEMINNKAGIQTTHVPYKSSTAAQMGLLSQEVDLQLDTPLAAPLVKSGKLRALAVTTAARWPELPEVPTLAESGFAGFEVSFWLGAFAPAQTPPAVLDALVQAMRSLKDDPNALRQLQQHGAVELMEPKAFGARIRAETAAWGEVIRRENIQLD